MSKKPEGHEEMTKLLGKLVQVPKKELDAALAKDKPKPKKTAAKRKK
jgi:hypothetical protein